MREFRDRVAVVTGAASGIGRALAERFAREGMRIVLADVEERALAEAEAALRSEGATVVAVPTDVSRADQVEALAGKSLDAFGAVHVVCNNAGVASFPAPVWEQPLEDWEWVLGVNLWGVIHGIRSFVPILLRQDVEGHVLNTASLAGLISFPFGSPYHATKHAVVTISESLHHELAALGSPIKVSVLCPGFVNTRIMDSERNRPERLQRPEPAGSEAGKAWEGVYRASVAEGLPPAAVADRVLEAIRDERFWVFPHPEGLAMARERSEAALEQRNPTLGTLPPALGEILGR